MARFYFLVFMVVLAGRATFGFRDCFCCALFPLYACRLPAARRAVSPSWYGSSQLPDGLFCGFVTASAAFDFRFTATEPGLCGCGLLALCESGGL